ncbi:unnamed protein product, partial [Ectocarpus sp. 6 AP-2014]
MWVRVVCFFAFDCREQIRHGLHWLSVHMHSPRFERPRNADHLYGNGPLLRVAFVFSLLDFDVREPPTAPPPQVVRFLDDLQAGWMSLFVDGLVFLRPNALRCFATVRC